MLVKKAAITKAIIPLTNVVQEMVHFIFALPVFIIFLIVADDMSIHIVGLANSFNDYPAILFCVPDGSYIFPTKCLRARYQLCGSA